VENDGESYVFIYLFFIDTVLGMEYTITLSLIFAPMYSVTPLFPVLQGNIKMSL
jgi:hypothetical protein